MSKRQFLHIIAYSACLLFLAFNHVLAESNFPRFTNLKKITNQNGATLSGQIVNPTSFALEPWFEVFLRRRPNEIVTIKTGKLVNRGSFSYDLSFSNMAQYAVNPVLEMPELKTSSDSDGDYYCYRGAMIRISRRASDGQIAGYYFSKEFPVGFSQKYPDASSFANDTGLAMDTVDLIYASGFGPLYDCGYLAQPMWYCAVNNGSANAQLSTQRFARRALCHYWQADNLAGAALHGCYLNENDCLNAFASGNYDLAKKRVVKQYYYIARDLAGKEVVIKTSSQYQDTQDCEVNLLKYSKDNKAKYKLKEIYIKCYDEEPIITERVGVCSSNLGMEFLGQTNFTTEEAKISHIDVRLKLDCQNKEIQLRKESCQGELITWCNTGYNYNIGEKSLGCLLMLKNLETKVGGHQVFACVDKNGDGKFDRFGESVFAQYDIYEQADWLYFDWRNRPKGSYVTRAKDQDGSGTCADFRTAAAIESRYLIERDLPNTDIDLSESFFSACANENQKYANQNVVDWQFPMRTVDENCFPYNVGILDKDGYPLPGDHCANRCADWQQRLFIGWEKIIGDKSTIGLDQIKAAIRKYGPIHGHIFHSDAYFDEAGHLRCGANWRADVIYSHAVLIVGYSQLDGSWIIKNSWGTGWGDDGFIHIPYGECGMIPNFKDEVISVQKVNAPGEAVKP
ncbi:MAG: C1 family peptidase [Candidatus Paceibacterota bacterium]